MKLTIAFFTSRKDARFSWFADSLARWAGDELDGVQVIAVDRHLWSLTPEAGNTYFRRGDLISLTDERWHVESRREEFERAVGGRFELLHLPVAPSMYQGPFRLTTKDWFCAARARNTAIMAAEHPYFVGIDDLSVITSTWWAQVKHAASSGYPVAGAYWKKKNVVVENGEIKSVDDWLPGRDTRWDHGSDTGIVQWHGGSVFGCSFGIPLDLLLKINGQDEILSGEGGDDYDMGIRAQRAGGYWQYNRNMLTIESEEMHHLEPSLPRERKIVTPENLPADYASYPKAREDEQFYSDHVFLNRLRHEKRITTIAQWTQLRQAREEFQASQRVLIPTGPVVDWRDGGDLKLL